MVPDYRAGNPYQELLSKELEAKMYNVEFDSYPYGLFPLLQLLRKHKKTKVLHIHWISELLRRASWSNNNGVYRFKCLMLFIECWLIRLSGKKIIWTIHNKFAHEGYDRKRELLYRKFLVRGVNQVIVHSKEALEELEEIYGIDFSHKTQVIHHGNYLGYYPTYNKEKQEVRESINIPNSAVVIGYFGQIRSYKGVELLINSFNELNEQSNIYLMIAGKVDPNEYADKLIDSVKSSNIRLKFEFLSDQDLINYIEMSDIICLPFSDTLTSGSVILAMSCKKALLLPERAKIFGCVPDKGVRYFESQERLKNIIEQLDLNTIEEMGNINYNKATNMSWQTVAEKTVLAYVN